MRGAPGSGLTLLTGCSADVQSKQYVTFSPFLSAADLIEQRANADALDLEKVRRYGRALHCRAGGKVWGVQCIENRERIVCKFF